MREQMARTDPPAPSARAREVGPISRAARAAAQKS
jgi:hypothetical protein